eukprot:29024-Pelagococcus_subviridis.AAC.9
MKHASRRSKLPHVVVVVVRREILLEIHRVLHASTHVQQPRRSLAHAELGHELLAVVIPRPRRLLELPSQPRSVRGFA